MLIGDSGGGLFLSPVEVPPGDPGSLAHAAGTYTAAHGEIARSHATLTGAAGLAGGPSWTGTGAASYVTATTELASVYSLTAAALARGATALKTYSTDLHQAQQTAHQANAAVSRSNSLASAYLTAQATAQQSAQDAQDASDASTTADTHAAANPHSPSAKTAADNARTAASNAQSAASSDAQRASAASNAYSAAYSHAVSLCSAATQQAKHASTKAAAAFDAATTELSGQSAKPVAAGAKGVPGGGPWQTVLTHLATWNGDAGWGLNAWGAFGAVVIAKAEMRVLEAKAGLGQAVDTYDEAVDGLMAGKGFWSSGYYDAEAGLNGAFGARRTADTELLKSIVPAADDTSALAKVSRFGLVAGMASDAITIAEPGPSYGPDGLLGGNTDRGLAAANLAASGLALGYGADIGVAVTVMGAIPGLDLIVGGVLVGTAAYFAGEFVYQHFGHTIAHSLDAAGSWVGHEGSSIGHDVSKAFSWL
jgi:hypothetical protein